MFQVSSLLLHHSYDFCCSWHRLEVFLLHLFTTEKKYTSIGWTLWRISNIASKWVITMVCNLQPRCPTECFWAALAIFNICGAHFLIWLFLALAQSVLLNEAIQKAQLLIWLHFFISWDLFWDEHVAGNFKHTPPLLSGFFKYLEPGVSIFQAERISFPFSFLLVFDVWCPVNIFMQHP